MNTRTASWATLTVVLVLGAGLTTGTAVASVGEDHKVTICHVPPGNPENAQSIEVDEASWSGHRNHRLDYEGPCQPVTTTTTSSSVTTLPETTTSVSTTIDTTTSTTVDTTTTTTSVPSTTTTIAPTTTNITAPPPSVLPETTVREQPGPVIDNPATVNRDPAPQVLGVSKYRSGELAYTGTPYEVVTMVLAGLLVLLAGAALVRCSRCKRDD